MDQSETNRDDDDTEGKYDKYIDKVLDPQPLLTFAGLRWMDSQVSPDSPHSSLPEYINVYLERCNCSYRTIRTALPAVHQ